MLLHRLHSGSGARPGRAARRLSSFARHLRRMAVPLVTTVALVWLVSLYGLAHHDTIYTLALVPRTPGGLLGILTMPLVHGSFAHLYMNTTLLLVLGGAVLWRGNRYAGIASAIILLLAGSLLWLVGRPGAHIGASVLIYGYFGLLSARGLLERRIAPLVVSLVTVVGYVSLLWGIVPGDEGVSWEGHVCGLLAGVVAARVLRDAQKRWV